jgi:hypothetical protein
MLQVPATIQLAFATTPLVVHLFDISKTGVAFASGRDIDNGSSFMLSFSLPQGQQVTVEGRSVYSIRSSNGDLYRIGARIVLDGEALERVRDFISLPP